MYQLFYVDPCWSYDNKGTRAKAENHYPTMTLADLKRLPVHQLAAPDAVLVMWWVGPMENEARQLAESWGFKVKNMKFFTWLKLNECAERNIEDELKRLKKNRKGVHGADVIRMVQEQLRMGLGNYTRSNAESALVAVRGNGIPRVSGSVKQSIIEPIGRHSAKPAEARRRLEELYGPVPRIELFSRGDAPGWHHWGNENPRNDVELVPASVKFIDHANDNALQPVIGEVAL